MIKQNIITAIVTNCNRVSRATRFIGVKYTYLLTIFILLVTPITHAGQFNWPPMFGNQQNSRPTTPAMFPFAFPTQKQPVRQATPSLPFPWMGGSRATANSQWNTYRAPSTPFGGQSGFSSFSNPMMGFGGIGGLGSMATMVTPMVGIVAPMMTNYAVASMNPTTMSNFFGLMSNQGGGMTPFGGFGFPGGGFGAPSNPFQPQNRGSTFPWFFNNR